MSLSKRNTYRIAIALNLAFVAMEVLIGLFSNSLGLVSDAGHKLLDVFSLIIALVGFRLASHEARRARRISSAIAMANAFILIVAVCIILIGSISRLRNPGPVDGSAISWTAGIGIIVSGLSAWLLMRHRGDINTRAAFLHMATDSLLSLGVVASGILISLTGWHIVDPLVSLVIASVILYNAFRLFREALQDLRHQT